MRAFRLKFIFKRAVHLKEQKIIVKLANACVSSYLK